MNRLVLWMTDDVGKLLLRLSVGGLMLIHGLHKLMHGIAPISGMLTAHGLPGALAYGVYLGEIVAPVLLILGYYTRPAALVLAGTMVVAIGLAKRGDLLTITPHGGWAVELNALFLFGALALVFLGSGTYALSRGKKPWD